MKKHIQSPRVTVTRFEVHDTIATSTASAQAATAGTMQEVHDYQSAQLWD